MKQLLISDVGVHTASATGFTLRSSQESKLRNKLFLCTDRFTGFTEVSEEDNDTGASLVLTRASTFASVNLKVSEVSHNARGKDFRFISQMIEHIKV